MARVRESGGQGEKLNFLRSFGKHRKNHYEFSWSQLVQRTMQNPSHDPCAM
jgi:hypothetical protein